MRGPLVEKQESLNQYLANVRTLFGGSDFLSESLILAQDERWRRA